ncbi:MAG: DUF3307 domain-containing protein [Acidobacteriaceae bacterium]
MHPLPAAFLALLLAHLLGDFPLQPRWIARNKTRHLLPLLLHGAVHGLLAWVCLLFFGQTPFLSIRNQLIILCYILVHLAIDGLKSLLIGRSFLADNGCTFLLDQLLHGAVMIAAALFLSGSDLAALAGLLHISPSARSRIVETAIIYVGIVFGGGYLIRYITRGIAHGVLEEAPEQLQNAGLYIGWIERALVITAMALQSPALVGLILTGKSIARFPEFKEPRFAEYFLIGTLLSILLAVLGGVVLLQILYGTVALK